MIYWLIGQPGTGKTTLARALKSHFDANGLPSIHLDGDDLRKIFGGTYHQEHFTKEYRDNNTKKLQDFVEYIDNQGISVVVSTVNPTRSVRNVFKHRNKKVKEIYVVNYGNHLREDYAVKEFEEPMDDFILVNTTGLKPEESFKMLMGNL